MAVIRASRATALAILVAVIAVPVMGLLLPAVESLESRRSHIEVLESQLAKMRTLAAARDELLRQNGNLAARRGKSGMLLMGESEALAAANLQNIVKTAVARAGGELRSTQSLPVTGESGVRRMTVRAHLSTDTRGLRVFLHAIEGSSPILFVDDLDIRGRTVAQGDDAGGPVLDVRIDLTGYLGGE